MTQVERTQLLIVGGGPVGLLTALCAARQGLDVTVIERSFRGSPRGHTTLLHPSSIRLLGELGLSPLLLREGRLIEEVKLRVNSDTQRLKLPFPALAITQSLLEETLLKVLRKEQLDLRATCEVTSVIPSDEQVEVRVVRREQVKAANFAADEQWDLADSHAIQAEFVIGADGRASQVRRALGIHTAKGPVESYAMFEYPSQSPAEPELIISDQLAHLVTPLSDRCVRCSFQVARGKIWNADLTLLATLLAQHAPEQAVPSELYWCDVIDFEPAVAEQFGRGRIGLTGDAAHTASPLGVQSMNRGFSEARQLTEEIAAVSAGKAPLARLERLGNAHREDWLRTLATSADFQCTPQAPGWISPYVQPVVSALPASGPDLEALLRQLGIERRA